MMLSRAKAAGESDCGGICVTLTPMRGLEMTPISKDHHHRPRIMTAGALRSSDDAASPVAGLSLSPEPSTGA